MRRLSGEDGGFLSLELPFQPMNSMALAVLQPAVGADGRAIPLDLGYLRRHMAVRLDELPAFRWRVQPVPFGLHHPVFVDDRDFDLDYHLGEVSLPAPGGAEQLDHLYASLAERTLDRRHPLWQLILVTGLQGGRQAAIVKVHHCLMDGFATFTALQCIFSGEGRYGDGRSAEDHEGEGHDGDGRSQGREVTRVDVPWRPERAPRASRLIGDALRDQGRALRRLPALIRKTKGNLSAAKAARSPSIALPKAAGGAPATCINRGFTADRRFARTSLRLADVNLVKTVAGVRLNDVALAVVAGALCGYLEARGELPAEPLVASVPVGMEPPGAPPRTFGNRFSGLTTSLATHIADPWERLAAISAVTAESKRQLAVLGPELLPDWLEYLPPAIVDRVVRVVHRRRRKHPEKLDANIVISNLRGPRVPWSLGSAMVEEIFVTGPPNSGVGVNVSLWDYRDRLLLGILTFADSVESPGELAEGLHRALAELVQIAEGRIQGERPGADHLA